MADVPTAAQALFPGLPSAAAAADRAPPPDRSAAQSIYGSPEGGLARARAVMNGGVAQPAGERRSEPGAPPGKDWLTEVSDRGDDRDARGDTKEAPERPPAAGGGMSLDPKSIGLEPSDLAYDFASLAGEMKLSRGAAKEFVDLHQAAIAETSTKYWDGVSADWEKASTTKFGGRLPSMVDAVRPVLNGQLTTPGFRALLETYKLGSNPDVIETLHRWAQAMGRTRSR